jgi:signal transduction histidine kinase
VDQRRCELAGVEHAVCELAGVEVITGWVLLEPGDDVDDAMTLALERSRTRRHRRAFAALLHDLTTPVSSIHGVLTATLDGVLDPDTERRFLEAARSEAARIGRLIHGFIDDHHEGAGADAHGLLQSAMAAVEPLARARGVTLRVCSRSGSAPIGLDPDRALALFVALLENAIKHGKANGRVTARALPLHGNCVIKIDDDGPGVPPADAERIFSYGTRSGTARGFGIGLAHARRLVEAHGGEVCVEKSPMNGARFLVRLPMPGESAAP